MYKLKFKIASSIHKLKFKNKIAASVYKLKMDKIPPRESTNAPLLLVRWQKDQERGQEDVHERISEVKMFLLALGCLLYCCAKFTIFGYAQYFVT